MKIILETERLYLREFKISDAIFLFKLNEDLDVLKYTGDVPFNSVYDAKLFLNDYNDYKKNGFGRWAVCLKKTHDFIGWCGLKKDITNFEVDLGFRFYKNQWGKGYATEAGLACIQYGFNTLTLNKIIGRAFIKNKASIQVLKKCNFKLVKNFIYHHQPAYLFEIKNDIN